MKVNNICIIYVSTSLQIFFCSVSMIFTRRYHGRAAEFTHTYQCRGSWTILFQSHWLSSFEWRVVAYEIFSKILLNKGILWIKCLLVMWYLFIFFLIIIYSKTDWISVFEVFRLLFTKKKTKTFIRLLNHPESYSVATL